VPLKLRIFCTFSCLLASTHLDFEYLLFRYLRTHPGHSISRSTIQSCVCECIKPDTIKECACPTCTDFQVALKALRGVIKCNSCEKTWGAALQSTTSFEDHVCCKEEVMHGMRRKKSPDEDFHMRPLECTISSPLSLGGPGQNLLPCKSCGMAKNLPENCPCFSSSSLDRQVTWLKRQQRVEGKPGALRTVMRLCNYRGTVRELLAQVKDTYKALLYHRFCFRYTRRQHQLDCDYFDPITEALILADFASAMVRVTVFSFFVFVTLERVLTLPCRY